MCDAMQPKIMYIEFKGDGLAGDGRIGLARFSQTGRTVYYGDLELHTLNGRGYKANFFDVETGEEYWVSGPRRDGNDALYPAVIHVDEDVREEYWTEIRGEPERKCDAAFRSPGKYSKRKPANQIAESRASRRR